MAKAWSKVGTLVGCALALTTVVPGQGIAEGPTPAFIPPDAPWLTTVNYFREMSGLSPVSEDPFLSDGSYKHSCYMLQNDITHDEIPGRPGYTPEGAAAGRAGNVAVSSVFGTSARSHIELWMTGPFHAIGLLRPNLQKVGFGKCDSESTAKWRSGATLDVLRGLGPATPKTAPILWPGNGTTTNLHRFIVETPDPRDFCGWQGQTVGLPVIALMPEDITGNVTASVSGPNGVLPTCALSELNTTGTAQQILDGDDAIVAMPRTPLTPGTYTVTVTSQARSVTWSFTVDPNAAFGDTTPAPKAAPSGPSVGYQPLTPARVVDTREGIGATRLEAGVTKAIQIAGRGGVPAGASAVSGFTGGEVTPNAATIPLDANGQLCVFSTTATELVIDVNGFYASAGAARFTPINPVRIMDSREGLGAVGPIAGGRTVELQLTGANGVPAGASAVTLNVTSTNAAEDGFVTVYACDGDRPVVSNLNPSRGKVRPNLVVTPVSASGTVCLFTLNETHLVVDVTGFLSDASLRKFTPTLPFRYLDTRDRSRPEVNAGTSGNRLAAGQTLVVPIAGLRGVPSNAKAVSLNLTVTDAVASGYITAWPCGERPVVSTANYEANRAVSNGAQLPLSADGSLCIFSPVTTHVVLDINGWWS